MKLLCLSILGVALFAAAGCGKKEITALERKQAANLVSEAQFAGTLRDYARAETLLAQATALTPDMGHYWVALGSTRMRLGQKGTARAAYQSALHAFEDAADQGKAVPDSSIQQIYVLALLGRVNDARALQKRLVEKMPDQREVRAFAEEKRLDAMLADPQFKQVAFADGDK